MAKRVRASDVLDPNAVVATELEGRVVGRYRQAGPNRWDDFELVFEQVGDARRVKVGEALAVEPLGAEPEVRFRLRAGREVLLLSWLPTEADRAALATGRWGERESERATALERLFGLGPKDDPRDDLLAYFLDVKTEPFEHDPGLGAAAVLVHKLKQGRRQ